MYKNEGYGLWINQSGHLEFGSRRRQGDRLSDRGVPNSAQNIWYFVAVSYDANERTATLYQEGVVNRYNSLSAMSSPSRRPLSHVAGNAALPREAIRRDFPSSMAGAQDWHELRGNFVAQNFYTARSTAPPFSIARWRVNELDADQVGGEAAVGWHRRLLGYDGRLHRPRHRRRR